MPRVLHVLPHRGGGGEAYIDLLDGLAGYEHERVALSSSRTPLRSLPSILGRWPGVARRAAAADLVHAHGDVAAALSGPMLSRRPGVITTHGLHLLRRLGGPARPAFVRALRASVGGARVTICTSQVERQELVELLPAALHARLEVIFNGVPAPPPVTAVERAAGRAELGLQDRDVLFLFLGQLEPRKDPLAAVSAAIAARERGAPIVLALAGRGPLAGAVAAAEGAGVRSLGFRPDVRPLLAAADVFVLPSAREGLSMALLEAMSHGLPAIVCDGSGNPEAVGEAGVVVPFGQPQQLAAAFSRLALDEGLRARLGAMAKQRAASEFGVQSFLRRTRAVYERVLGLTPDTGPGPSAVTAPATGARRSR